MLTVVSRTLVKWSAWASTSRSAASWRAIMSRRTPLAAPRSSAAPASKSAPPPTAAAAAAAPALQ